MVPPVYVVVREQLYPLSNSNSLCFGNGLIEATVMRLPVMPNLDFPLLAVFAPVHSANTGTLITG
jgi:hypothetical protein